MNVYSGDDIHGNFYPKDVKNKQIPTHAWWLLVHHFAYGDKLTDEDLAELHSMAVKQLASSDVHILTTFTETSPKGSYEAVEWGKRYDLMKGIQYDLEKEFRPLSLPWSKEQKKKEETRNI